MMSAVSISGSAYQGFMIFCLGGGGGGEDCVQRSIVCEACEVFEPILILSINHQCTKKHKARVFIIRYCINCQNFGGGGGEVGGFGGEASPPHPPVDETLLTSCCLVPMGNQLAHKIN